MASTQLLRRRIKTAQNVSKTTRAMQMIAASKLKKAQDATLASRPYVEKLMEISKTLAYRIEEGIHPFLKRPDPTGKKLILVLAPDKGLCGGLVTNLSRELFSIGKDKNLSIIAVGKKIERYVAKLPGEVKATFPFNTTLPTIDMIFPIVRIIEEQYLSNNVQSVHILSTHFVNIFSQKPVFTNLLPLLLTENNLEDQPPAYTVFEPGVNVILGSLLKHYVEMVVYQHMLESFVSEQAARMAAMQNATDNAKEIIEELTLSYNKVRQSRITNEILDISSSSNYTYA